MAAAAHLLWICGRGVGKANGVGRFHSGRPECPQHGYKMTARTFMGKATRGTPAEIKLTSKVRETRLIEGRGEGGPGWT